MKIFAFAFLASVIASTAVSALPIEGSSSLELPAAVGGESSSLLAIADSKGELVRRMKEKGIILPSNPTLNCANTRGFFRLLFCKSANIAIDIPGPGRQLLANDLHTLIPDFPI